MAMHTSSRKKGLKKKKEAIASPLRRRTLATLAVMGLGIGLSIFGLFGQNIVARTLYLEGKRMKSKGHPLFLIEGWILSEQDLHHHKKK